MLLSWVYQTYKASSHSPVSPRQLVYAEFFGKSKHDVQQRDEACRLHRCPSNLAINIEARLDRRLAHGIPIEHPLYDRDLRISLLAILTREASQQMRGSKTLRPDQITDQIERAYLPAGSIATAGISAPSSRATAASNPAQSPCLGMRRVGVARSTISNQAESVVGVTVVVRIKKGLRGIWIEQSTVVSMRS